VTSVRIPETTQHTCRSPMLQNSHSSLLAQDSAHKLEKVNSKMKN